MRTTFALALAAMAVTLAASAELRGRDGETCGQIGGTLGANTKQAAWQTTCAGSTEGCKCACRKSNGKRMCLNEGTKPGKLFTMVANCDTDCFAEPKEGVAAVATPPVDAPKPTQKPGKKQGTVAAPGAGPKTTPADPTTAPADPTTAPADPTTTPATTESAAPTVQQECRAACQKASSAEAEKLQQQIADSVSNAVKLAKARRDARRQAQEAQDNEKRLEEQVKKATKELLEATAIAGKAAQVNLAAGMDASTIAAEGKNAAADKRSAAAEKLKQAQEALEQAQKTKAERWTITKLVTGKADDAAIAGAQSGANAAIHEHGEAVNADRAAAQKVEDAEAQITAAMKEIKAAQGSRDKAKEALAQAKKSKAEAEKARLQAEATRTKAQGEAAESHADVRDLTAKRNQIKADVDTCTNACVASNDAVTKLYKDAAAKNIAQETAGTAIGVKMASSTFDSPPTTP